MAFSEKAWSILLVVLNIMQAVFTLIAMSLTWCVARLPLPRVLLPLLVFIASSRCDFLLPHLLPVSPLRPLGR